MAVGVFQGSGNRIFGNIDRLAEIELAAISGDIGEHPASDIGQSLDSEIGFGSGQVQGRGRSAESKLTFAVFVEVVLRLEQAAILFSAVIGEFCEELDRTVYVYFFDEGDYLPRFSVIYDLYVFFHNLYTLCPIALL